MSSSCEMQFKKIPKRTGGIITPFLSVQVLGQEDFVLVTQALLIHSPLDLNSLGA